MGKWLTRGGIITPFAVVVVVSAVMSAAVYPGIGTAAFADPGGISATPVPVRTPRPAPDSAAPGSAAPTSPKPATNKPASEKPAAKKMVAGKPATRTSAAPRALTPCSGIGAPRSVTATAGANSATVTWQAPTTGTPIAYLIKATAAGRAAGAKAVPAAASTATLTGLAGAAAHTLTVTAVADCGVGPAAAAAPVTPSGAAASYPTTILADAPLAYYRLGEPAAATPSPVGADSSGHDDLLTYGYPVTAGTAGASTGDPDTGVLLNGGCCAGTARPALPANGVDRTVEAWVKPTDGYLRWVAGWGDYDAGGSFELGTDAADVVVGTSGAELRFPTPAGIVGGGWHQVAATYTHGVLTAYLDGVALGSRTLDDELDTTQDRALIVGGSPIGGNPAYGGLDEVAVYPTALSATRLAAHFAASGHRRPGPPAVINAQVGEDNELVVSWGTANVIGGPANRYVVTALVGGVPRQSTVVAGTKTAARMTGLAGGTGYTFRVVAGNEYGEGPAAASTTPVAPTGPATTYATTVLTDAPRAYYRLGEAAGTVAGGDSSGRGQLLSYRSGVATFARPGAIGNDGNRAVRLNGSCCLATARADLPRNNATRSVEAWVKPADANPRFVVGWGDSAEDEAFDLGVDGDHVLMRGYGDDLSFATPTSLVDGVWHHVVVTYSGTTVAGYLDGLPLGSRTLRNSLNTGDDRTVYLGSGHGGDTPFYGELDEVAVYSTYLSAAQVAAHFAASAHGWPSAVTALTATPDVNQVRVSWTPTVPADGITTYQVTALVGGAPRNSVIVPGTVSTAVLTGLAGGTAYTVRVTPSNPYGDGPAATSATVIPTGAATSYASTVLAAGPAAYFRLGEAGGLAAAANSAAGGRPLITRSTTQAWRTPGALRSDPDTAVAADGGCCVGSSRVLMPRFDAARTVQAWVRPADGSPRWIAGWGASGEDTAFDVGLRASTVVVNDGNTELAFTTPRPLTDGVWHHVTVAYAARSVTAYLDGQSLGVRSFPDALNTTVAGNDLWVGAGHGGGAPFYGGLDEVAVYPVALTAAQVDAQFAASGHGRPGAVGGVTVAAQTNAASVSWNAPAAPDGVTAYRVIALVGGVARNSVVVPGTVTSAALTGLAGGTAYTVRIISSNAYGDGPAATSSTPVTPGGVAGTYAATVLADAPGAYYRLGEGTGVSSGADSAGGAPLAFSAGARGLAGAVTGDPDTGVQADGGCCVGVSAVTPPRANAARTVEAWVKPADGYLRWIAGWGTSRTEQAFNVGLADNRVIVSGYYDDLTFLVGRSLLDGVWHHVAVSFAGNAATVYVDGVSIGTRTFAGDIGTVSGGGLHVGAAHDGSSPFYGGLDEVAVYPAALSADRVAAHFAASGHRRPAAVTALAARSQANALAVSWNATPLADGVSYYLVTALVGGVPRNAVAVPGSTLSTTLTGLAGGTAYPVQVVAVNGYGRGPAATSAAATPTGPAGTYAGTVLADAPSAYYRLGEAAGMAVGADSSPAAAPLTYGPPATLRLAGAVVGDTDGAVNSNGNCCVGAAHNAALPSFDTARTVESWVKPADTYLRWVLGWGTNRTDRGFDLGLDGDRIVVAGYADDLSFALPRPLTDGAWHHVAATYSGASVTVYLDGSALGTKSFAGTLNTVVSAGDGLRIGASQDGSAPFYGDLDEVAVYPTALSAARIAAHFAASGHTRPGAVTALVAAAQPNALRVSWAAPTGAPTRYLVTALKAGVARNAVVVAGNVTTATLTGLAGATAYTVRVTPANAYGDGPAVVSAAATPTGAASTYASTVLADAPAAYYRLGEATGSTVGADSAGGPTVSYGGAGTLGGAGALAADPDTAPTVNGGCCLGVARPSVPTAGGARSVEAWVKPSDTYQRWLVGWGASAVDRSFNVGVQGDGILVSAYGDDLSFTAPSSLADGLWHHVVLTYAAGTATAYVDGARIGAQAFTHALNTKPTATGVRLGATHDGGGGFYGVLDEVAIYRTALTAAQVTAHYRAGVS